MGDGRVGDVLVAINDTDVTTLTEQQVKHVIATTPVGSVCLTVCPQQTTNIG